MWQPHGSIPRWTFLKARSSLDFLRFTLSQKDLAIAQLLASNQRLPEVQPSSSESYKSGYYRYHSAASETEVPDLALQFPKPV